MSEIHSSDLERLKKILQNYGDLKTCPNLLRRLRIF